MKQAGAQHLGSEILQRHERIALGHGLRETCAQQFVVQS
jgi:hypothetical protein